VVCLLWSTLETMTPITVLTDLHESWKGYTQPEVVSFPSIGVDQ
jgi:hypothetical protein